MMFQKCCIFLPLFVMVVSIISTIHAQPTTIAAWGDSRLLGLTDVGAPVVWEPRIFNRAFSGERLDKILHLSSNDHGTIAYCVGGIFGWGGFSAGYKHAKYFVMKNEPDWSQDPIKELVGAGSFWMALTQSGKVYSWSVFTSENGCKSPYQVFGTLLADQLGCYSNITNIMPLGFSTSEPNIQVGCHATYCVSVTSSKVFYWGIDPSDSFEDTYFSDSASPFDMQAAAPSGFTFTNVAVARHGSLSEWFVVIGRNITHASVLFTSGRAAGAEDDRFLVPEPGNVQYSFLINSPEAALPQDFATSWIALGLDHGVIASTSRIFVWGSNKFSQLGLNSVSGSYIPLELTSSFPAGTVFAGLSVNNMTSYVLTASGEIYVFGPTRNCDDTRELCIEENSAFYGRTEIRRTTERFGPTIIPLPITATAPPTFSHIPGYVDGRGVLPFYGTAFHVLGVVKDDVDEEPYRPLPAEAILGWGAHHQAPIDGYGGMPFGIDIGNYTTSAQLMSFQKPTLVALPAGTRSISMLSTLWHSASALIDVGGTLVPYIWGSMAHNQTFSTPNMSESTYYISYPPTTYSQPVNMTSKLDFINSDNTGLLKFMWANDGLIGQYAKLMVSYSRFSTPDAWTQAIPSTAINDEISCSTRACGILQQSTGRLTVWSMDTEPVDDGFNICYRMGLSNICSDTPQVVTSLTQRVLKFSLAATMSLVVVDQATNSIQTSGYYGSPDRPVLGTTSIIHTSFTPINFTHLGQFFPGSAVVSHSLGYEYSMFIVDFAGSKWIFGFGANQHGQIVGRDFGPGLLPTRLPDDWVDGEPTYIACVRETTFLLTVQGSIQKVFVWGYNGFGHMYGFGGVYNSKSSKHPRIFQLPEYLGGNYVIKSFTQGETASTVFAHLTSSGALNPYREPDQRPQRLMAIGSDVLSDDFVRDFPRMLPQYYGVPTFGTELGRGEIGASETITNTAVGQHTTWHLTSSGRLYGSGRAVCLPLIDPNATIDTTTMIWEPVLFLDMSMSSVTIVDISAHDMSVIFLLSNRTVGFLVPSSPGCPLGIVLDDTSAIPSTRPYLMAGVYDKIHCHSYTCCFLNANTSVLDCFGASPKPPDSVLQKRESTSSIPSGSPTISISGFAILDFWVVQYSVIFRVEDNIWYRYHAINGASPITGLENRTILQVASGYSHTIVNTDTGMFSLQHGLYMQMSWQQFGESLQYAGHTNVSQVAVWGHRSIWVNGTDIWYAGLELWGFTVSGTQRDYSMPQVNVAKRINLPEGAELDKLISRATDSDRSSTTNHIIMVTLKPKMATPSEPPTATATDIDLSCTGAAPFPGCTCINLEWRCTGSYNLDGSSEPVTISTPVDIQGDLTVSAQGALSIDLANLNSLNGKPYIRTSGCIALLQPVSIELKKDTVTSVPSGKSGKQVNLMESSCYQSNSNFVNVKQTEKKCRKISSQPAENKDNTGRVSLSVIFRVQSDSCDHWWIILVSFFGTAIVVVSVIVVVFVKSGTVQLIVQPYRGVNT